MKKMSKRWGGRIAAVLLTATVMMTTACGGEKETASGQENAAGSENEQTAASGGDKTAQDAGHDTEGNGAQDGQGAGKENGNIESGSAEANSSTESAFTDEIKELYAWVIMYADTPLREDYVDLSEAKCKLIYDIDPDGTPAINVEYFTDTWRDVLFYMRNGMVETLEHGYRTSCNYLPYKGFIELYGSGGATAYGGSLYTFPDLEMIGTWDYDSEGDVSEKYWWGDEEVSAEVYQMREDELGISNETWKDVALEGDSMTYEELLQFLGAR